MAYNVYVHGILQGMWSDIYKDGKMAYRVYVRV